MNRKERRTKGQPTQAEFDRIADRVEATGCERCGTRFGAGLPYLVARTRKGWVGRCMTPACNADFLPGSPLFIGIGIFNNDPWTESDRDWFCANPRRRWRLRWPMPGEVEALATDEHVAEQAEPAANVSRDARNALLRRDAGVAIAVAVHQFTPGRRLRIPVEFLSADPPESFTDAAIPVFAPSLVETVARSPAARMSDADTQAAVEVQKIRRLDAVARIIKPGSATP